MARLLLITKSYVILEVKFQMISERKKEYYDQLSKKLNDPLTTSKTYWSIFKTFYSGTKIPLIPPIIIDNKVIRNFREKANVFNIFFALQCMAIVNDSILPSTIIYRTENRLSAISFKDEDVLKIIKSLNINKAHGHDDISIRLLQICGAEVVKPLSLICKNCGKSQTLLQFISRGISSAWLTIVQFGFCQYVVKYLRDSFLTQFLSSLRKTNYFLQINLVLDQMTLVKINCCQLSIVFMQILIKVLHLK